MDLGKFLPRFLGGLGVLIYVVLTGYVIAISWKDHTPAVPAFIDYYVMAVSTTLATYIGMVIGLKQTESGVKEGESLPKLVGDAMHLDKLQIAIAFIYIGTLIATFASWMFAGFDEKMTPIVQNLTKSLVGLMLGALAVYLNIPRK